MTDTKKKPCPVHGDKCPDQGQWNPPFKYRLLAFDTAIVAVCVAASAVALSSDGRASWIWPLFAGFNIIICGWNAQMLNWWKRESFDWRKLAEQGGGVVKLANAQFEEMFGVLHKAAALLEQSDSAEAKELAATIRRKAPKPGH